MSKKIVFLLSSLSQGGSERQMLNTATLLRNEGNDVSVLTYHDNDFYGIGDNEDGIEYKTINVSSFSKRIFALRKELQRQSPDYIVTLCGIPSIYTLLSSIGMRNKVVLNWRNNNTKQLEGINGVMYSLFSKRIHKIICNSYNGMKIWCQKRPADNNKVNVIYNLVELKSVQSKDLSANRRFRILIPARVCPDKNPEGVIEAVTLLPTAYRSKLEIVWKGRPDKEYGDEIKKLTEQYKVTDVLHFQDATKAIEMEILQSNAVGLFSHREGFPNAICEAMMLGKPIIMTPVSDYSVLCKQNGILCASDKAEDISEGLMHILDKNDDDLNMMGCQSKAMSDELLNNEHIKEQWLEVFTQ